jgi:hypothetical protein
MNPITGEHIGSADSIDPRENSINGHEQRNPDNTDLQKACIFELATLQDCAGRGCYCRTADAPYNRAICQAPDGDTELGTQYYGSANPGLRQLEVLRGIGESAVVASACPKSAAADDPDRGYFPALRAIRTRLTQILE